MILANYSQVNRMGNGTQLGNAFTNPFANFRPESFARFYTTDDVEGHVGLNKSAFNNGYAGEYAWHQAPVAGGLSTHNNINGVATLVASAARGINLVAPLAGVGSLGTPSLRMVVSLAATLAGTGAITATLQARLNMAASLAGSGSLTAALKILAKMTATLAGTGSVSANLKGKLSMSADIFVNQSEATAGQIALAVWNSIAEGAFTYEEVVRIIAAAAAGKTSNDGQTFRDLSDTKNRITGTVVSDDRATAVYDTD